MQMTTDRSKYGNNCKTALYSVKIVCIVRVAFSSRAAWAWDNDKSSHGKASDSGYLGMTMTMIMMLMIMMIMMIIIMMIIIMMILIMIIMIIMIMMIMLMMI